MIIITFFVVVMATTPLDLDATQSSVDGEFYQSTYMPGSLIGNWNAKTNPEGTTTLPGYWGGSGNNIIGCDITPSIGGPYDSSCTGGLEIGIDSAQESMTLSGLLIDAFGEGPATFPVTLGMLYETFRTVQPSSLYPGDIPFEIPLGEGSLTTLKFEQVMEASANLTIVDEQTWSYSVVIPVTITVEAELMGTPTGPIVSVGILQLSGTVEQTSSQLTLTGMSSWKSTEVIEDPPIAFENIPFDIPTIIPAGGIAQLLLSAVADNATIMTAANLQIVAVADTLLPGDVDGDGVVGVNDLLAVIGAWGPCQDCVEDLNNDGVVNVTDVLEVIANWSGS
jgi:hypothetical protein